VLEQLYTGLVICKSWTWNPYSL